MAENEPRGVGESGCPDTIKEVKKEVGNSLIKKRSRLLLIALALIFIALAIRLIGLGEHSLFADELVWMVRGKRLFFAIKQLNYEFFKSGWWLSNESTEPLGLPMALLGGTMLAFFSPGQSRLSLGVLDEIIAARIPPVVISSLFIGIYYFLIRKYVGRKVALVASLLLAFDPVYLGISRWFHQDLLLMIPSFLALAFFARGSSWKNLTVSSFCACLAILTKPHGILVVVTLFVYLLTVEKRKPRMEFWKFFKWALLVSAFTIGLFPFLWKNPVSQIILYWKTQAEIVSQGQPMNFLGQIVAKPAWYYYLVIFPFHLPEPILLGIIAAVAVFFVKLKNRVLKINPFFVISLIYCLLLLVTISWAGRKLGIRYFTPVWPFVYMSAGYGLVKISDKIALSWQRIYWLIIIGMVVVEVVRFYPSYYLFHNNLISPQNYQQLESIGFCDGIKPAMEFLAPRLHENVKILFFDCNAPANYYTGYTIKHVHVVEDEPEFVVVEPYSSQKFPEFEPSLGENGYSLIKQIFFRGILLANIYTK